MEQSELYWRKRKTPKGTQVEHKLAQTNKERKGF